MGMSARTDRPMRARYTGPTAEEFHLGQARRKFSEGRINIEAYEIEVERVLRGRMTPAEVNPFKPVGPIMIRERR